MNATIEPRLIALLNDEPSETYNTTSLDLPPLSRPSIFTADGRPLLSEPETKIWNANSASASASQLAPAASKHSLDEGESEYNQSKPELGKAVTDRALGGSSPQSLRKILDDTGATAISSKKRPMVDIGKDDFVQLPQPPKKHKAAKQVVPPIIIGLFEPPPQAALFPPIASSSFHDSHGRNSLNIVPTRVKQAEQPSKCTSPEDTEEKVLVAKTSKKKDVRARKKWTEDETNNLLLGVAKHGVGSWTEILEDSRFSFNERSGADLKDRFRTCCPAELRESNQTSQDSRRTESSGQNATKGKPKSSLMSENILISNTESYISSSAEKASSSKVKKTRTHRRKVEDLVRLGIEGPFRKSHRRERRPFTDEEDHAILDGYKLHGPAWTRIHRDPTFNLQSRQPTDLRDRFRNRYPEKFHIEDKGDASNKGSATKSGHPPLDSHTGERKKESSDLSPAVDSPQPHIPSLQSGGKPNERGRDAPWQDNATTTGIIPSSSLQTSSSREGLRIQEIISTDDESSKILQPHTSLFSTFSDPPAMEASEGLPFSQSFDWSESMTAPFSSNMGEMDISRLLLDETWIDHA